MIELTIDVNHFLECGKRVGVGFHLHPQYFRIVMKFVGPSAFSLHLCPLHLKQPEARNFASMIYVDRSE
jgi:hypothetical protein